MTQRDDVIPSVIRHLGELAVENIMKQNEVTNYTQRMEWNEWCVRRALSGITRRERGNHVPGCVALMAPTMDFPGI